MTEQAILILNTFGQALAGMVCVGMINDPSSGASARDSFTSTEALDLLDTNVGPISVGFPGLLSFLALFFKESKSKSVWFYLTAYHGLVGYHLFRSWKDGTRHAVMGNQDLRGGLAYHVGIGIASLAMFASLFPSITAAAKPSNKKISSL